MRTVPSSSASDPTNEVGVIGIREGYVTAAVDRFGIRVKGIGCHGAHPDDGIDPIPVAAAIIQGLHSWPQACIFPLLSET